MTTSHGDCLIWQCYTVLVRLLELSIIECVNNSNVCGFRQRATKVNLPNPAASLGQALLYMLQLLGALSVSELVGLLLGLAGQFFLRNLICERGEHATTRIAV